MPAAAPTKQIPALDMGVPVQHPVVAYATDGAITLIAGGVAILTKSTAGAYTLAAPVGSGAQLVLIAGTAQAHTVTVTGGAGGSGQDVGTFGGAINDSAVLYSYNSQWYIAGGTRNVTFA